MKARNKFQKAVVEAGKTLPPISEKQIQWAYKNCLEHMGRRTKKGVVSCLECGHSWQGEKTRAKHCHCPNCNAKLQFMDTRKRVFKQEEYLCIVTSCKEFQVLRYFYVECYAKVGQKAKYFHSEVVQKWIAPNGKYATLAKLKPMGFFASSWRFHTDLEIRHDRPFHNIYPNKVYPFQKLIPEIKRSGYQKEFHELAPFDMFQFLLSENRAETLMKTGQIKLLQHFVQCHFRHVNRYWASIRICMRNNYQPDDANLWCDYIDLLRFFGKDLHNAKHVCPSNLHAEHDKYVAKKRKFLQKQKDEEKRQKAWEDESLFYELKSKFFGLQFSDDSIQVKMLESVEQVMQEGDVLHHCVFTNNYHLKPGSLIFSASIGDKKLETVEVSLSKLQVTQSRGLCNENTAYHDRIIGLVNKNMAQIEKRVSA